MVPLDVKDSSTGTQEREQKKNSDQSDLQGRMNAMHSRARRFMETLVKTKATSDSEIAGLRTYFNGMRLKDEGDDGIRQRETFFYGENGVEGHGKKMENSALDLYTSFTKSMDEARSKKLISEQSKNKWIARFEDRSVLFAKKEYWVKHQMPHYITAWTKVSEERKSLIAQSGFDDLLSYDSKFSAIKSEDEFLKLHFDKRRSLLAEARAALKAGNRGQIDLFAEAQTKLNAAVDKGVLSPSKLGPHLEKIFKARKDPAKVKEFISGNGAKDLPKLINNWTVLRERFDDVAKRYNAAGDEELPRGLHLLTEKQFLDMPYEHAMHYVSDMERRIGSGASIAHEPDSFIKIRHAMDTRDWPDALMLIADAKKGGGLDADQRERLSSMERYAKRYMPAGGNETADKVGEAKKRLDEMLPQIPASMQPMIMRLLRGPHANRNIHQLRWIVYNNKWCRDRGYLTEKRAFQGASEDQAEKTKYRAEQGMDIGINDTLSYQTAGRPYFRKKEMANHKPTYLHVNTNSGGATNALAEKMEHEIDPAELYWTTFSANEDGVPKSDNWHNDLFYSLTEMRSLTRTINGAGYMYNSPYESLTSLN